MAAAVSRPATFSTIPNVSAPRPTSGNSTSTRPTKSSRPPGWKKGADGIRAKDGKKLKFVFQTSTNTPRQKTQAIVKQAFQKAGIELELKTVTASVFFSSDVANPDTYTKFYSDIQMYNTGMGQPDPTRLMAQFLTEEISSKEQQVAGSQHHALDTPRVRQALQGVGRRTRSGQTRGDVHPHERSRMRRSRGAAAGLSPFRHGRLQQIESRSQRLGHQHRQSEGLVPRGMRPAQRQVSTPRSPARRCASAASPPIQLSARGSPPPTS